MISVVQVDTYCDSSTFSISRLRSCVSGTALVLACWALSGTAAQAANYLVSSEAEFIAAVNSINGDVDPDGTITLTSDVTLAETATVPVLGKSVTIDTSGGHTLTVEADISNISDRDTISQTGGGEIIFAGQNGPQGRLSYSNGTVIFKDGARNGGGNFSKFGIGTEANSTTNFIVSGAGTQVDAGVGSGYSNGDDSRTLIRVEDGGVFNSISNTGISSQTVGTGGFATVEVVGAGSLFTTGRLTSGLRGSASYSLLDGGQMETRQVDVGGNVVNAGLGDSISISGADSSWTASGLFQFHDGDLTIREGGALTTTELRIAPSGGREVVAVVSGETSKISTTAGDISLGGTGGGNTSTGILTVADGALLEVFGGAGDINIATGPDGAGVLNIGGSAGAAAASAGVIEANSIAFGAGDGTVNFNHTNANYDFTAAFAGAGVINHTGTGRTILGVDNSGFTGVTNVEAGSLAVNDVLGGVMNVNGGQLQGVTIGRADLFAPETACKKALALLGEMAEGRNPNKEKKQEVVTKPTLADAFDSFFKARPHLSPHTVSNYTRTAKLYLKAWRKKPIHEITRQMALKRHQELSVQVGRTTANNVMRHLRSVYNYAAATHDEFPPNPVQILTQARAWHREQRRQTLVTAQDLPMWWKAVRRL